VFAVAPDAVTAEMRRQAKVINFGIIYGMGAQRLSRELGITVQEADDYIRRYFARYAKVREFSERVIADGAATAFVATLIGRRRYLRISTRASPTSVKRPSAWRGTARSRAPPPT